MLVRLNFDANKKMKRTQILKRETPSKKINEVVNTHLIAPGNNYTVYIDRDEDH